MAYTAVRWFTSMSPVRRWSAAVLRILLIALISGILAGATAVRRTDKLAVIAVIDVSGSVQRFGNEAGGRDAANPDAPTPPAPLMEQVRRFLKESSAERGPDDLMGVVLFDADAAALVAPTRVDVLDQPFDATMAEGTDIAQALRLAAAMAPVDATVRYVLFSDGVETSGDSAAVAREFAGVSPSAVESADAEAGAPRPPARVSASGRPPTPIDVVPIAYNVRREVMIESVDAPPVAQNGALVSVRVVLETAGDSSGTLQLLREGQPLDINGDEPGTGRRLILRQGRHVELITVQLPKTPQHRFDAVFEPDLQSASGDDAPGMSDTIASNNRAQAFTFTPGKGSVLVVDGVDDARAGSLGQSLPDTLRDAGLEVKVISPDAMPSDPLSLQAHDLIILANVPADAMSRQAHAVLAAYVREQGGGLVMIGGRASFGAGAWKGTDIEPILPVALDLPERLVVPAAAIVFVLDNSGSMGRTVMGSTRTQQRIANEGAALALLSLDKGDLVGFITFNGVYDVQIPLARNSNAAASAEIIRSIRPEGATNIPPALEEAHRQLKNVTADVKHVILLTDGRSNGRDSLPALATRMHDDGIQITTIGVGDNCDETTLKDIAARAGGVFYPVTDPNTLPRVFVKAVRVVRSPMVRESPFTPVVLATGSPIVEGLGSALPPLGGITLTQPRTDPLITTAMLHPGGEPLLAHWNVGLGRVAAFTSDAARWSRDWIPTPAYRQFWTNLARVIARPESDRSQELSLQVTGSELQIRLDATGSDAKPLDLLSVPGSLYLPSGERVSLRLSQTGPGVYEATAPAPSSGNYVVTLTPKLGSKDLPPVVGGVSRASGVEYRRLQSNVGLLEEISRTTGGKVYQLADGAKTNLFDRSRLEPTEARLPLWRTLLLWAVVVLMLDIGTRRIAWDRLVSREFGATLRRESAAAMRDRGEQAANALGRLRTTDTEREERAEQIAKPASLSEDDAKQIVREQAQRRRAAQAARQAAQIEMDANDRAKPDVPDAAPTTAKPAIPAADAPADDKGEGGLFAAKRRARERMDRDKDA